MVFAIFFLLCIGVAILQFTGHLRRWGMEWLWIALAIAVYPIIFFF